MILSEHIIEQIKKRERPKCFCPWCDLPAEEGCVSLFAGKPTCRDHSASAILADFRKTTAAWVSQRSRNLEKETCKNKK